MPLAQVIASFKADVAQAESLIANAHRVDASGAPILPAIDQRQITVAAYLNLFVAWETFLEQTVTELMIGSPTLSGSQPTKYVSPLDLEKARAMVIGTQRYFDYANADYVKKLVRMYFEAGYPFEPHFSGAFVDIADMRTLRNASAHVTSTTQTALESLAFRIFGGQQPGIDLYTTLTRVDPRSNSNETVFVSYKNKLVVVAELIVQG